MKDLDRIFGETLANHTSAPSTGLWDRVEANLPERSHSMAWARWAAVFIPALVAASIWLATRPETNPSVTAQSVTPALQPVETARPVTKQEEQLVAKNAHPKKTKTTTPVAPAPIVVQTPARVEESMAFEEITLEPVTLEEEVAVAIETPAPMVLVYTLETVSTPETVAAERKTIDRVVDFARTVKHSDPIGDIRGLKDELFALDLRKKQPKKN